MASNIDATKPAAGSAVSSAELRTNFQAAKTEIEALQQAMPPVFPRFMLFDVPGSHYYVVPLTGRYFIAAAGAGGSGTAWIGNPPFGTTGSPPRFGGGSGGSLAHTTRNLTAGSTIPLSVGQSGDNGTTTIGDSNSSTSTISGGTWNQAPNYSGLTPWAQAGGNGWGVDMNAGAGPGGNGTTVASNVASTTSPTAGASVTFTIPAGSLGPHDITVSFQASAGGRPGMRAGHGKILFAYLGPPT